jgi:hypothetical protein
MERIAASLAGFLEFKYNREPFRVGPYEIDTTLLPASVDAFSLRGC